MKQKNLLILAGATTLALAVAAIALRGDGDSGAASAEGMLFPELSERINDITRIHLEKGGESATLELADGRWCLADRGGYPALFEKVKQLAVLVASLEIEEKKTARKANHARLSLEWPPPADGEADGEVEGEASLITLQDASGAQLASVVVGKSEWGSAGKSKVFVRRADEDQVYLCVPPSPLNVMPEASNWLETKFVELENERVQGVTIEHADGERVEIARSAANHTQFAVQNLPPGQVERFTGVANGVAQALGYGMQLKDVRPADEIDFTLEPLGMTRFRCTDGLELLIESARFEEQPWVKVTALYVAPPAPSEASTEASTEATGDGTSEATEDAPAAVLEDSTTAASDPTPEADVRAEVESLNERLSPWAFEVDSYKTDVLVRRMQDLVPEPETPTQGEMSLEGLLDPPATEGAAPPPEEGTEGMEPTTTSDDEESAETAPTDEDAEPE
jgi:hypothetical protein